MRVGCQLLRILDSLCARRLLIAVRRDRLSAALGVDAFNEYGMGELLGPGMACECPVKDGMHVWSDHLLVECIDPETCEPVADGEPGELVWTSLTSDSMAMIRYRSHDLSSLSWAPCACGRTHPRIGRITGRSDDALSIGGLVVFPSQIEEALLRFDEVANNFCMVVENVNNLDRLTLFITGIWLVSIIGVELLIKYR